MVLEVVLRDGLAQKGVALLGSVAVERLAGGFVVDGPVEGGDHGGGERLGDVADAEADDLRLGMGLLMGLDAMGDFGEQIGCLNLQVVFIDADHSISPWLVDGNYTISDARRHEIVWYNVRKGF